MLSLIEIVFYITLRPACSNAKQQATGLNDNSKKCDSCRNSIDYREKHPNGDHETKLDTNIMQINGAGSKI